MDPSWWAVAIAGLFVGFVVGMTGMGGGALMTPMMILLFGIQPLAAVSSDLVASMVMKPVGGAVHLRAAPSTAALVKWLVIGSVPSAFAGVLVLRCDRQRRADPGRSSRPAWVSRCCSRRARWSPRRCWTCASPSSCRLRAAPGRRRARWRPSWSGRCPTLLTGIIGGLVVGMTSVGSGSLMIVSLLLLYPSIRAGQLVGTDLVQAVPLVASASLGHLLFGDFQLDLTVVAADRCAPGRLGRRHVSSRGPLRHRAPRSRCRAARFGPEAAGRQHHHAGRGAAARRGRRPASCGRPSTGGPGRTWATPRRRTWWVPRSPAASPGWAGNKAKAAKADKAEKRDKATTTHPDWGRATRADG